MNHAQKHMNIVFFGSSQFAVPSLQTLLTTQHKISCVVTQPDRKKGRGLHFEGTVVKTMAEEFGIKIYQPQNINTDEATKFFKDLNPDLFIVISYGQILSQEILDIPKIFCLNVHASSLPRYRGAAPINWAIINGEKNTGVTIIKMTDQMDAGWIILQKMIEIKDDDTAITLEDRLSKVAAESLFDSLQSIEDNHYQLTPQDEREVSFAPKLKKEDGLINWNKSAYQIYNLIRGILDWPGAFTYYQGKLLKIYKARVATSPPHYLTLPVRQAGTSPGEVMQVARDGIIIATQEGNLIIEELQIENKRRMKVAEFISGHKIQAGEILGKKSCNRN